MQAENKRLRKIQHLAHEIMDEMNAGKEWNELETLIPVIDNLSRAIGDLTDAYGNYSLDYVEEKVKNAHTLLFKKNKVDIYQL
ncbi:group-specific protein [Lysinibacillus sp. NPDC093712]|uniref:group-specific protein n=1 Tax=Lysinibacillus sp. NPDC093712 TaxID=3390579 RepID=UPI003D06C3E8